MEDAPPTLKDGNQAIIVELKELNFGTNYDRRAIFISGLLSSRERWIIQMLIDCKDVFVWAYKESQGSNQRW